jgi:hypothetical protein
MTGRVPAAANGSFSGQTIRARTLDHARYGDFP